MGCLTRLVNQTGPYVLDGHKVNVLRKHERLVVHLTGVLDGQEIQGNGILLNLSTTGCAMRSDRDLHVGDLIALQIFFPETPVPLVIPKAAVRWVAKGKCGLDFLALEPDCDKRLQRLLQEHHLLSTREPS